MYRRCECVRDWQHSACWLLHGDLTDVAGTVVVPDATDGLRYKGCGKGNKCHGWVL